MIPADGIPFRRLVRLFEGTGPAFGATILLGLMQAGASLLIPLLARRVFEKVLPVRDFQGLAVHGVGIASLYVVIFLLALAGRRVSMRSMRGIGERLRRQAVDAVLSKSKSWHVGTEPGTIHSVLVRDTERVDGLVGALIGSAVPSIAVAVVLLGLLLFIDPRLSLMLCLLVPLLLLVRAVNGKATGRAMSPYHREYERFSKRSLFLASACDLVKTRGAEGSERARQGDSSSALLLATEELSWRHFIYAQSHNAVVAMASVLILVVGGWAVTTERMTPGALIAFFAAVSLLMRPVQVFFSLVQTVSEGLAGLRSVDRLIDEGELEPYRGTATPPLFGAVRIDGVTFGYPGRPLFEDASFSIAPGEVVGIVGPNGCGKSTLFELILGFHRPSKGSVSADGIPYDEIEMSHLRRAFAVVRQDPYLFTGSVRENIAYGRSDADDGMIRKAASAAGADDFLSALPEGYGTTVGERGVTLSGGQRQRIAISRALLGNPRLLLLDEPTNHLDEDAVRELMAGLRSIEPPPGIVVVSHHKEILSMADRILILSDGGLLPLDESASRQPPSL